MVIKELSPIETSDPLLRAGHKAEEQMAHYLRRAFGEAQDLYLFHDLRLERDGDAAQMDHLLVHRYGMIIIESKSVMAKVEINEHGEWLRNFRGLQRGMPSPVEQARRQGEFLRAYLQEHREQLRGKYLLGMRQGGFLSMPLEVLVAISDEGIIRRPKRMELPEVLKADQVPARLQGMLKEHRRANSLFNLNPNAGGYEFRPDEMERIIRFLQEHHRPRSRSEQQHPVPNPSPGQSTESIQMEPEPSPSVLQLTAVSTPVRSAVQSEPDVPAVPDESNPEHRCRHCESDRLLVESGRYGYFFKCGSCEGNTPIRETCKACGEKEKLRKSGPRFFAECGACSTSRLYYVNQV